MSACGRLELRLCAGGGGRRCGRRVGRSARRRVGRHRGGCQQIRDDRCRRTFLHCRRSDRRGYYYPRGMCRLPASLRPCGCRTQRLPAGDAARRFNARRGGGGRLRHSEKGESHGRRFVGQRTGARRPSGHECHRRSRGPGSRTDGGEFRRQHSRLRGAEHHCARPRALSTTQLRWWWSTV